MSLRAKRSNPKRAEIAAPRPFVGARNDKKSKIWVSGSIARDLIMDFSGRFADHIDPNKVHVLNLSFAVENLQENYGGTAANVAYNLALLNQPSELVGAIGQDQPGFLPYLRAKGVGCRHVKVSKRYGTTTAYIITDRDDNQIAGFYMGAMKEQVILPPAREGDRAIVGPEKPENMVRLARFYQKRKINFIFDPGQQVILLTRAQLMQGLWGAKVLIGNDYEIGLIQKSFSPAIRGRLRGGRLTIAKTLGPKGSEILFAGRKIRIGIAKPQRVLDPTGAGDAYRAGFLKGLILGYNLKTCGQLAATAASFAVEEYGTQNHKFTWSSIVRRNNRNFRDKIK